MTRQYSLTADIHAFGFPHDSFQQSRQHAAGTDFIELIAAVGQQCSQKIFEQHWLDHLPHEQRPNPYITDGLSFEFHYFFMRKLWFAHLARALVVFPGGFGTLDEMMEILTLMQTRKIDRRIPVILFGSEYWNEVVDFEALVRHGMIDAEDLKLFQWADEPARALELLQQGIAAEWVADKAPAIAHSRTPRE